MRRAVPTLLMLVALLALAGCQSERERLLEARAQATADAAATIFEAATAIEQGVDPAKPLTAIKVSSASIIRAQDRQYPPADAFIDQLRPQKPAAPAPGSP